jgi:hypothetical protein
MKNELDPLAAEQEFFGALIAGKVEVLDRLLVDDDCERADGDARASGGHSVCGAQPVHPRVRGATRPVRLASAQGTQIVDG